MRVSERAILGFYNALSLLFCGPLLLKKAIKFGRRGHAHEWDIARWNAPLRWEKNKPRIVFVALSWGEVGILNALSQRLEIRFPHCEIIWSIRDKAARELAETRFPSQKMVAMPFDFTLPAQNWVQSIAPDVLIVVEKFWWPNLIYESKARGAKIILINGRSRGREKLRYRLLSGFQRWVLSAFDLLLFESEAQIERVRAVLPRGAQVVATGNIKFALDAPATKNEGAACDSAKNEASPAIETKTELQNWLESRARGEGDLLPLLIAGSTSPLDEKWALEAFESVRREIPCALLIAPRRPSRAGEVAAQIQARGWKVSRRTAPLAGTEILLLDTLGELSTAYRFGVAAYVGGATEGRGHNIIEPLSHGIAVSYGPNRGDFEGAQRAAESFDVGFRLHSSEELAQFWKKSLTHDRFGTDVSARAKLLIDSQRGALDATVDALVAALETTLGAQFCEGAR